MSLLTHDEAQRRADLIRVTGYDVSLDLTTGNELFGSTTTVRFAASPDAITFLDVAPRRLHAARLTAAISTSPR